MCTTRFITTSTARPSRTRPTRLRRVAQQGLAAAPGCGLPGRLAGAHVELVDKYQPQLVWFDWWIEQTVFQPYLQKFAAYYYNRGEEWGQGVAINFKYSPFPAGTAVYDIERGQLKGSRPHFWQNDTSVSKNSWGYIHDHDYKDPGDLIQDLVDVVSKNGALLLNIGPRPDGTIPEQEQRILLEIGAWLRVNGEAIYNTRPWRVFGEGPTEVPGGLLHRHEAPDPSPAKTFASPPRTIRSTRSSWAGPRRA